MIAQKEMEINRDTVYLIEALKVEGYWSSKNFTLTIQNKDIPLLNHIEKITKDLGVRIGKRILLKIRLPNNTKREDIKIWSNNKELNFHIEESPFDKNKVKAVTSLPYKKSYKIVLENKNRRHSINIKYLKNEILYKSDLECWTYGDLRFPSRRILDFLDKYSGGKKELNIPRYLERSKELISSAFSALIDCEGSINHYGLKRIIRVRMRSRNYLEQWDRLLNQIGVGCKFRKNSDKEYEIDISGWEDFNKLSEMGVKFYNSKKEKEWGEMIKGFKRNQISRNSYKEFYIKRLKELDKKVSAKEFSSYIKKSKRVANHYLLKLEKGKLISCDKKSRPYLYFISTSSVR